MKRCLKFVGALLLGFMITCTCFGSKAFAYDGRPQIGFSNATSTSVVLNWDPNEVYQYVYDLYESGDWTRASNYQLKITYVDSDGNTGELQRASKYTSSYTITGMYPYVDYSFDLYTVYTDEDGVEQESWINTISFYPSQYVPTPAPSIPNTQPTQPSEPAPTVSNPAPTYPSNAGIVQATKMSTPRYYSSGFGKTKGLSVTWQGYSDMSGYEVTLYNRYGQCVQKKNIYNPYTNYCTLSKATTSQCYSVKVRCFLTENGVTTYSQYSNPFYAVPQARLTAKKSAIHRNRINLKWAKVAGASSYVVYARKHFTNKWYKVKTLSGSKTKYTFSKFRGKKVSVNSSGYDIKVVTNARMGGCNRVSLGNRYTNYYLLYI